MAGLLDALNSDEGMQALGLLAAAGPSATPMSFGQRLFGAMQQDQARRTEAEDRKAKQQMQQLQLQALLQQAAEQKRMRENEDKFRGMISSPQMDASQAALSGGGGPTLANAAQMKPVDPMAQIQFEAMRLGQIKPLDYISAQRKDMTPMKVGRDDRLVQPGTNKILLDAMPKEQTPDEFERALKQSGIDPNSPQAKALALARLQKLATHQPPTNVNVNTSQNPFFQGLGKFGADQFQASTTTAQEAAKRIDQNATIENVLSSGNVYTGTGAEAKLAIGKALQSVGVNIDPDAVRNTELLGTQLAQRTLNSIRASGLGAGNGFTNADREFLQQAVGGSIQLTAPTLKRLVDLDNRAARATIQKHNKMVEPVSKAAAMQGFPMDFTVPMPEQSNVDDLVRKYTGGR